MKRNVYLFICIVLLIMPQKLHGSIFMVNNAADSGTGSLRQSIINSNSSPGRDTIQFNLSGTSNWNINPATVYQFITDPLFIDGLSQPGSMFPSNLIKIQKPVFYGTVFVLKCAMITIMGVSFDGMNSGGSAILESPIVANMSMQDLNFQYNKFENWSIGLILEPAVYNNFNFSNNNLVNVLYGVDIRTNSVSDSFNFSNNSFLGASLSNGVGISLDGAYNDTLPWSGLRIVGNYFSTFETAINFEFGGLASSIVIDSNFFSNISSSAIYIENASSIGSSLDGLEIIGNAFDSLNMGQAIGIYASGSGNLKAIFTNFLISNNQIYKTKNDAIRISTSSLGLTNFLFSNITISSNYIRSVYSGIFVFALGTGFSKFDINSIKISNNIIARSKVGVYFDLRGSGSSLNSVKNILIDSNIIRDHWQDGIRIARLANCAPPFSVDSINIINNDIFGNNNNGINIKVSGLQNVLHSLTNISISNNNIFGNSLSGILVENDFSFINRSSFRRNSIYGNGLRGIVTTDITNGYANPVIPVAVLDSVVYGSINGNLYGHLSSQPLTKYIAEIFTNSIPDSSGFGEGETFLDTVDFVTDSTGYAQFQISVPLSTSSLYFSATVTDSVENCTSPFSNTVSSLTTVINEISEQELLIYPNPASNLVFISIPQSSKIHQIELMNLTGQVISRFDVKESETVLNFSTLDYPAGCYFLRAFGETSLLSKLIIQHD